MGGGVTGLEKEGSIESKSDECLLQTKIWESRSDERIEEAVL